MYFWHFETRWRFIGFQSNFTGKSGRNSLDNRVSERQETISNCITNNNSIFKSSCASSHFPYQLGFMSYEYIISELLNRIQNIPYDRRSYIHLFMYIRQILELVPRQNIFHTHAKFQAVALGSSSINSAQKEQTNRIEYKITPCATATAIGGTIDHVSIEYSAPRVLAVLQGIFHIFRQIEHFTRIECVVNSYTG